MAKKSEPGCVSGCATLLGFLILLIVGFFTYGAITYEDDEELAARIVEIQKEIEQSKDDRTILRLSKEKEEAEKELKDREKRAQELKEEKDRCRIAGYASLSQCRKAQQERLRQFRELIRGGQTLR